MPKFHELKQKLKEEGLDFDQLCLAYEADPTRNPISGRKISSSSDVHKFFKRCHKSKSRSNRGAKKVPTPAPVPALAELLRLQAEQSKLQTDVASLRTLVDKADVGQLKANQNRTAHMLNDLSDSIASLKTQLKDATAKIRNLESEQKKAAAAADLSDAVDLFTKELRKLKDNSVSLEYFYDYTRYLSELARTYAMDTQTGLFGNKIPPDQLPLSPRATAEKARAEAARARAEAAKAAAREAEEAKVIEQLKKWTGNLQKVQEIYMDVFKSFNPQTQPLRKFILLNFHPDKVPKEIKNIIKEDPYFARYVSSVFVAVRDRTRLTMDDLHKALNVAVHEVAGGRRTRRRA